MKRPRQKKQNKSRRTFLKTVPVAVAGAVATKAFAQGQSGPISGSTVDCAETIAGLEFHGSEEEAIANSLNQNLNTYRQLRQIDVPQDVPPAIQFHPYLPGERPPGPATPGQPVTFTKPQVERPDNLEDAAFWPVAALAALIERRLVTSTELTQMYLERLKRHSPTLYNVVTLTEDLALEQAAAADRDIAAGRYRGPLHGIPWGAKDLFATKGIPTTWGASPYENQVIDYDATIVERLREAGAVLVAKLSMGALAQGGVWFGGSTRNPWNTERSSSGSSAGPGSATAAGLVAYPIGRARSGSALAA